MLRNVFNNVWIKLEFESGVKEKFSLLPDTKGSQKKISLYANDPLLYQEFQFA